MSKTIITIRENINFKGVFESLGDTGRDWRGGESKQNEYNILVYKNLKNGSWIIFFKERNNI